MHIASTARRLLKRTLARRHRAYRWTRRACMVGRYLCGRPHEADFEAVRLFAHRRGLFLDIGANSGESVLSFRVFNRSAPVLSIEPNPYHEPDLRFLKRCVRNFDYVLCAAGAMNSRATLYIPVYRNLPLTGEASFHREEAANNYWVREQLGETRGTARVQLTELPVDVKRLDDMALQPAFIKIDVQGFESDVVSGLRATIAEWQPVLLLERSGCDETLHGQLASLGYAACVYLPATRTFAPYERQAVQNLFFLPRHVAAERLP